MCFAVFVAISGGSADGFRPSSNERERERCVLKSEWVNIRTGYE